MLCAAGCWPRTISCRRWWLRAPATIPIARSTLLTPGKAKANPEKSADPTWSPNLNAPADLRPGVNP